MAILSHTKSAEMDLWIFKREDVSPFQLLAHALSVIGNAKRDMNGWDYAAG